MQPHSPQQAEGLERLLRDAGITATPEQLRLLLLFKERLLDWNETTNLISKNTIESFDRVHILDSLLPLRFLPEDGPIVDLGTGGGMPGIFIKIFRPDTLVTLAESKSRKIKFLQSVIADLNLKKLDTINPTVEKPEKKYRILVSRAFGPLEKITREAKRYLAIGGSIFAYKGRETSVKEELEKIAAVWHPQFFRYSCPIETDAAETAERTVVLLRKDQNQEGNIHG